MEGQRMQEVVKRVCMRCFCRSAGADPAEALPRQLLLQGLACHLFLELPGLQPPARRVIRNSPKVSRQTHGIVGCPSNRTTSFVL